MGTFVAPAAADPAVGSTDSTAPHSPATPPAGGDSAPPGGESTPKYANAFDAARHALGDIAERMEPGKSTWDTKPETKEADKAVTTEKSPTSAETKPETDVAKPADAAPVESKHYSVVGADGKPAKIVWPEGAKLQLTIAGKKVEVANLEQLVEHGTRGAIAQKAQADLSRATQTLNQERQASQRQIAERDEQLVELNQRSERLFIRALFQDEEDNQGWAEELRTKFAKFRHPDALKAYQLEGDLEERDEREAAAAQEEETQAVDQLSTQIWQGIERIAKAELASYPLLSDEDVPEMLDQFQYEYEQHQGKLETAYLAEAKKAGRPDEEALAFAKRDAVKFFSKENLLKVFARRNDAYKRVAERHGRKPESPNGETPASAGRSEKGGKEDEVTRHNSRTESLIAQRDRTQSLTRGGGAGAPASGVARPARPATWADAQQSITAEFDKLLEKA